MYTWLELASIDDIAQLVPLIDREFDPRRVADKLKEGLSDAVKRILIEHNYIDKDYRSTYYNFYAKKGMRYRADCVRLHFFDATVSFDPSTFKLFCSNSRLTDHYFGYMVLRPIGRLTIGRSVLSPSVRRDASRQIIATEHKVHLLGFRLQIRGFPSMDQHSDISVCAHSACWSILRHYSENYSQHREFLTHDITEMAQQFDPGGLIPARGFGIDKAERVFQVAGTYPIIVARNPKNPEDVFFCRQLAAYVESGFPLFAAMQGRRHAVAVVGYQWRARVQCSWIATRYAWDEIEKVAVVDDNHLPYFSIPADGHGGSPAHYTVDDIDNFIVPLPDKIYYPADAIERLVPHMYKLDRVVPLPPLKNVILRHFITTGAAYRSFIRGHESEYDPKLVAAIMQLPFTQFLWIVEFATKDQWDAHQVAARAVIDATARQSELYPYWILHNLDTALLFSRTSVGFDAQKDMGTLSMVSAVRGGFSRMDANFKQAQGT